MDRRSQTEPTAPPPVLRMQTFEGRPLADPTEPVFDQGLAFDVETLLDRRRMLKLIGVLRTERRPVVLAGCAPRREPFGRRVIGGRHRRPPRPRPLPAPPRPTARSSPRRRRARSRATARTGPTSSARAASCAATSARASARSTTGGGRAADDQAHGPRPGQRLRAARQAPRSTCGTATATATTRCTRRPRHENYLRGVQAADADGTYVHEHLPGLLLGPLAAHPLRGLPEPGRRDHVRTRSRRRRSRCPRTPATPCTRRTATARASATCAGQPDQRQGLRRRRRHPRDRDGQPAASDGYTVTLAVPVRTA